MRYIYSLWDDSGGAVLIHTTSHTYPFTPFEMKKFVLQAHIMTSYYSEVDAPVPSVSLIKLEDASFKSSELSTAVYFLLEPPS